MYQTVLLSSHPSRGGMKMKKILDKIKYYLTHKPKRPDCYSDENFMYCWCGKCKQKDYELPADFQKILAIKTVEHYKKLQSSPLPDK